jgi:hypothetical protein
MKLGLKQLNGLIQKELDVHDGWIEEVHDLMK